MSSNECIWVLCPAQGVEVPLVRVPTLKLGKIYMVVVPGLGRLPIVFFFPRARPYYYTRSTEYIILRGSSGVPIAANPQSSSASQPEECIPITVNPK